MQIETGSSFHQVTTAQYSAWKATNDYVMNILPRNDPYRPSGNTVTEILGNEDLLTEKGKKIKLHPPYDVMPFEFRLLDVANTIPA